MNPFFGLNKKCNNILAQIHHFLTKYLPRFLREAFKKKNAESTVFTKVGVPPTPRRFGQVLVIFIRTVIWLK